MEREAERSDAEGLEHALQASEDRYRTLVETSHDAVVVTDLTTKILMVSRQALELYGVDTEEGVTGRTVFEFVVPEDRQRAVADAARTLATGSVRHHEYTLLRVDGSRYPAEVSASLIRDANGDPAGFVGVVRDISERRRLESDLRASHGRILDILESMPTAFFSVDRDFRLTFVNHLASAMMRKPRHEVLGRSLWEAFPELADTPFYHAGIKAMSERIVVEVEEHYPPLDLWIEAHAYPVGAGLSVYFRDVSDRKRAEEALLESEERFRLLADHSTDIITRLGLDGTLLYVSPAARALLGYEPAEVVGTCGYDFVHPEEREKVVETHSRLREVPDIVTSTHRLRGKDGSYAWFESTVQAVRDPLTGGAVEIQSASRDISERKRSEAELQLTQDLALAIGEAATVEDALVTALRKICETTGWPAGQAWLVSDDGSRLECSSAGYTASETLEPFRRSSRESVFPAGADLPGRVWAAKASAWIEDVAEDPNFLRASAARECGLVAAVAAPVLAGDEFVGALEFFQSERRREDPRMLHLISTVGGQLGAVIQRKAAEDAVRRAQHLYRLVLDNSLDLVTLFDRTGEVIYASPSYRRILGYEPDDLAGTATSDLIHPRDRPVVEEAVGEILRSGQAFLPGVRLRASDGSWVLVEARGVAIFDDHDRPAMFLFSAHDMTERVRAEERVRDAERRYRALVEHVPAITYTAAFDEAMTKLYISPQVEAILGFTPREWTEDPDLWLRRLHPDDRERALATHLTGRERGEPFRLEYRMIAHDGREVWLRESAVVVRDADGLPELVHGIMVDITELKEAEHALRTAFEREREATRQLQRVDEMKSTFLRAASHELRTPITISRGHLEVLGPTPAPREIAETVDVVVAELGRMGRIVEDITTLVQADDPAFLRPEPLVLDSFLAELAAKARPLLGDRLQVDAVPRGAVVKADPDRMTQALLNLLHNSSVHGRPGGPVRLSAFESKAGWRFQVEDSGGGLPSGQEERLFQPLQRGPSAVKGSGLGLAIVRRIGEAHGGSAGADNRPGEGVTFWITVPR